jgi:hypothetical protein
MNQALGACLHWPTHRTSLGYGRVHVNGELKLAHRVAYCDAQGITLESISDKVVRHKCDTPSCFNPSHLEIGTQADNMHDMYSRGRAVAGDRKGERNGAAKLSADDVAEIKRLYVRGSTEFGCGALGKRFGVSLGCIHRIVTGQNWSHVAAAEAP